MKSVIPLPSIEKLKEEFTYDEKTGVLLRKRYSKKEAGFIHKSHGYRVVKINQRSYLAHRIIWKFVTGEDPGEFDIDHIDGDPTNNRWINLRLATRSQNCFNKPVNKNNKLGYKGVHIKKTKSGKIKYRSIINGKHIGYYSTPDEAYRAYLIEAEKVSKNFIDRIK
tara:strand:+ start:61 stop:558 length:498 start_codon:yes stop_codon:yes gene_type:complete